MITVKTKLNLKSRRRTEGTARHHEPPASTGRIPRITRLMALAIHFDELIRAGHVSDQSELAGLVHVTQPRMTQIMNLLHLAPDIQEEILHLAHMNQGRDITTERHLRLVVQTHDWAVQRSMWNSSGVRG